MSTTYPTLGCSLCGERKSVMEFGVNRHTKRGYQAQCKPCMARRRRERYAANSTHERASEAQRRKERDRELHWYRLHFPQKDQPWNQPHYRNAHR